MENLWRNCRPFDTLRRPIEGDHLSLDMFVSMSTMDFAIWIPVCFLSLFLHLQQWQRGKGSRNSRRRGAVFCTDSSPRCSKHLGSCSNIDRKIERGLTWCNTHHTRIYMGLSQYIRLVGFLLEHAHSCATQRKPQPTKRKTRTQFLRFDPYYTLMTTTLS